MAGSIHPGDGADGAAIGLFLIARIAGRAVAFPADRIESAVDLGPTIPAPRAAPGVVGLAALRSRVVTVVDPQVVLDLPTRTPAGARAVMCRVDGHAYALLVDALEDVGDYAVAPLPPGVVLDAGWGTAGIALIDRPGEPVLVVDIEQLLPDAAALAA